MKKWISLAGLLSVLLAGSVYSNSLDLLLRSEKGAALTSADFDGNYTAIENAVHALGTMSTQNSGSVAITGGTVAGITDLAVADGGTGGSTAAAARTNLALVPGTDIQVYDPDLAAIAALVSAADKGVMFTGSNTAATFDLSSQGRALIDDADATTQRSTLGLGTIATQSAAAVAITGGTVAGITDLAVADGGTGGSTAAAARTNLGVVPGTDVQTQSAKLDALASPTYAADTVPLFSGATTATTMTVSAAARTVLDDASTAAMLATLGAQTSDAELSALAGLTSAADTLPYFNGAGTATTTPLTTAGRALIDDADATAQRGTLGLGTIATQGSGAVSITGGSVTGITDLAVADGGTGSSTAAGARTNLAVVPGTDVEVHDADLTALAGVTSAADAAPYFTGAGTASTMTVTSTARSVLDDTTTSAMLTTLGAQAGDADLTSLAANSTNGALYHTAANTITARTPTCGSGLTCTNLDGVSGAPTLDDAHPIVSSYLTATLNNGSTTPTPSGIALPLTLAHYYHIHCAITYAPSAITTGLGVAIVVPASSTSSGFLVTAHTAALNTTVASNAAGFEFCTTNGSGTTGTTGCTFSGAPSNSANSTVFVDGHTKAGTTANLVLELYSEVTGNTNVKVGSECYAVDLGT